MLRATADRRVRPRGRAGKWLQREAPQAAGVDALRHDRVESVAEWDAAVAHTGLPAV
ncbi:hypothetical protein J7E96_08575 [Streptomyces sp. ISL-96]|uniref:hypothetical protein n=1 Tax=Streptomyces sp. ISL-96 TaxID=2819191 RepID=UPI001BEA955C|nr:hypothetical protein [Streptomyces sp. ISL-96]MBT2488577.1 hypothetical protein [Streptomyces sp. ISL-96]